MANITIDAAQLQTLLDTVKAQDEAIKRFTRADAEAKREEAARQESRQRQHSLSIAADAEERNRGRAGVRPESPRQSAPRHDCWRRWVVVLHRTAGEAGPAASARTKTSAARSQTLSALEGKDPALAVASRVVCVDADVNFSPAFRLCLES